MLTLGCLSLGYLIVTRLLRLVDLPGLETVVMSLSVGLVAFVLLMYAAGSLALYGPVFATALPLAMVAAGAPAWATRFVAERGEGMPRRYGPFTPIEVASFGFGLIGLGLVYIGLLTPDSLNYDATWSHVVIAQDYAREGRLVPFMADWNKCVPHLASIVYTWGFLVPRLDEPLRWMLALHLEFTLLLWTLAGVVAVVEWLGRGVKARLSWAAMFLFPGLFVYDGTLGGSADHVLASFAPPLFLAAIRAGEAFDPRRCALLGIVCAGALLTKYQAVYLLVPAVLYLAHRWVRLTHLLPGVSEDAVAAPRSLWLGPLALFAVTAVASSPHFVKNWVFYGNPVYPLLMDVFTGSTPRVPDGPTQVRYLFADYRYLPPEHLGERLLSTVKLLFTFSFVPQQGFTRKIPTFGSLFTLLLPSAALIGSSRLWTGVFFGATGVFVWAFTFRVDRNLQAVVPILAAVTAAILVRVWGLGWLARAAVATLVLIQVVWAADAPFFSGHGRLHSAVDLIRSGYEGKADARFDRYRSEYREAGRALPRDALVLLHNQHVSLGIDRRIVLDWAGFQGLIDYRRFATAADAHAALRSLGVSHIIDVPGVTPATTKQEDVVFSMLVERGTVLVRQSGRLRILELPSYSPSAEAPYSVLALGLQGYRDGLYAVTSLGVIERMPPRFRRFPPPDPSLDTLAGGIAGALDRADVVLLGARASGLGAEARDRISRQFKVLTEYPGAFAIHARRPR